MFKKGDIITFKRNSSSEMEIISAEFKHRNGNKMLLVESLENGRIFIVNPRFVCKRCFIFKICCLMHRLFFDYCNEVLKDIYDE